MDIVELSRSAWNALRSEHQPAFDDLEESYRQRLLDRTQNVITLSRVTEEGGVFQTFEQNVIEALNPERFHPLSDAVVEAQQKSSEAAPKKPSKKGSK